MSNELISIGEKIKTARKRVGLTQRELAVKVGTSESYISRMESGKVESPGIRMLSEVAKALNVPIGELSGAYSLFVENVPKTSRLIPLLDWICAGEGKEAIESGHPGHAEEYIETDLMAPRLFALRVQGDSMEPLFREGEVILINPDLEVQPGDYCVAKIEDEGAATLKQFQRVGTVHFLRPLNPAYKDIYAFTVLPDYLEMLERLSEARSLSSTSLLTVRAFDGKMDIEIRIVRAFYRNNACHLFPLVFFFCVLNRLPLHVFR